MHKIAYQKLPVCKSCGSVWKLGDCTEGNGKHKKAKLCMYVPSFTRGRRRQRCNGVLLKTVELASHRKVFYPLMTYCYIDLKTSLQHLLLDVNFASKCKQWKSRNVIEDSLTDVYDGRVWKRFLNYNGKPFLSDDYSFGCMINIDWFQPYKHLTYSVGAIYSIYPGHFAINCIIFALLGLFQGLENPNVL